MSLAREIERRYESTSDDVRQFMTAHAEISPAEKEIQLRERVTKVERLEQENLVYRVESNLRLLEILGGVDDRDRIMYKDLLRTSTKRKIGNSGSLSTASGREISIPLICAEVGVRPKGKEAQIGKYLVKLWRKKHNKTSKESPPKRETMFRGKPYLENTYYEEDRDIMENAIHHCVES